MSQFEKEVIEVRGARVVMLTAGQGEPLMFFHGAGTATGHDFALPWASRFKVMIPYHPGFGESGDAPHLHDTHDYVMHYVDLLDALKIDRINLAGFSMGGLLAARFASQYPHRVNRLALIAPAGMRNDDHPIADIFSMPPDVLMSSLASNFEVVQRTLPAEITPDFIGERYREASSAAKLLWERPYDPKLLNSMHRVTMPTMIVWGDEDKLIPVQQTATWKQMLPTATIDIYPGAGHLVLDERPEAVAKVASFFG